jgi:hypothetical protein
MTRKGGESSSITVCEGGNKEVHKTGVRTVTYVLCCEGASRLDDLR